MGAEFSKLINMMRSQGAAASPPGCSIGVVQSTQPLRIAIDGVVLEKGLWIDPARLDKALGTYAIKQGDYVVVQRSGEQFYILTKVVEV